jgi:hypothetical protein
MPQLYRTWHTPSSKPLKPRCVLLPAWKRAGLSCAEQGATRFGAQHLVRPEVMDAFEQSVAANRELLERLAK